MSINNEYIMLLMFRRVAPVVVWCGYLLQVQFSCRALGADDPSASRASTAKVEEMLSDDPSELGRLRQEAVASYQKRVQSGNTADASALLDRIVRIDRKLYAGAERDIPDRPDILHVLHDRFLDSAGVLANTREGEGSLEEALSLRREIAAVTSSRWGAKHWRNTDAGLAVKNLELWSMLSPKQREQLILAEKLNTAVLQAYKNGQAAQAMDSARQVLAIRREILGGGHPKSATSLNNLALLHMELGQYATAIPIFEEAARVKKEAVGEMHPEYSACINNLAECHRNAGQLSEAGDYYARLLKIERVILGDMDPGFATTLNNVALYYKSLGSYAQAEPLFLEAADIVKAAYGENHRDYALCLNNIALLYMAMARHSEAETHLVRAVEIRKAVLGEGHPEYANAMNNLALNFQVQGEYARAEPLFRQAMEILEGTVGELHPSFSPILNNLGRLYQEMGDYDRAQALLERSLALRRQIFGNRHPDCAIALNNLAVLSGLRGDYKVAESLFVEATDIIKEVYGERHPAYAKEVNNLAATYVSLDDHERAMALFDHALFLRRELLGDRHPDVGETTGNIAGLRLRIGDYDRSVEMFQEAEAIIQNAFGEQHPRTATMRSNLACAYLFSGDLEESASHFASAYRATSQHLEVTACVLTEKQQLAMAQSVRPRLDMYLSCLIQAGGRNDEAWEAVLGWKGATLIRQRAARICSTEPALQKTFTELQSVTRQWTALIESNSTTQTGEQQFERIKKLSDRKEVLEAKLGQLSSAYREASRDLSLSDLIQLLPEGTVLIDYLQFHKMVPAGEVAGKWDIQESLLAFVVQRDQPVKMIDLGAVASVRENIDIWRNSYGVSAEGLQAGQELRKAIWDPVSESLSGADIIIVSPDGVLGKMPFAALPGEVSGTYLIEDHRLATVTVPRLIESLLATEGGVTPLLSHDLLLMGDIDYDHRPDQTSVEPMPPRKRRGRFDTIERQTRAVASGMTWPRLAATAGEIAFIKDLYEETYDTDSRAIVDRRGSAATEEAFREFAPQCKLLHIATHGFFAKPDKSSALALAAPDSPETRFNSLVSEEVARAVRGYSPGLLSGIVLAGANAPPQLPDDPALFEDLPDDGILTAEEIAFLPLNGVQLVVLSACETGLGEVAGGEGVLGLQRAFQLAGARSTISSLWQVDDLATRRLMEQFYRNYLDQEQPVIDALRNAQLWLLKSPEQLRGDQRLRPGAASMPERSPPFYWAAFQLSGDWR